MREVQQLRGTGMDEGVFEPQLLQLQLPPLPSILPSTEIEIDFTAFT